MPRHFADLTWSQKLKRLRAEGYPPDARHRYAGRELDDSPGWGNTRVLEVRNEGRPNVTVLCLLRGAMAAAFIDRATGKWMAYYIGSALKRNRR